MGSDFYFKMNSDYFTITPKTIWDTTGSLSDESEVVPSGVLPKGFYEMQESAYEYDGDPVVGATLLKSAGFTENLSLP